ncbi:MAG: putative FAD synthetase, partial [Actinomyces urogenitalis DORA_12]
QAATAGVVPPDGVYAGWLVRSPGAGDGSGGGQERLPAAISIGTNPTFDDVPERTVEAHVLGRSDLNLYGEVVAIELVEHLRPMLAFDGLEPLLAQMRADVVDTARVLGVPVPAPVRPQDVTA